MGNHMIETLMGAVVLAVATVFLIFATQNAGLAPTGGYELNARFDRVGTLSVGSDVRVSGIKVGTVTGLELDPETFFARVRFSVSDEIELPLDTSARIDSEGLLGGNFLALLPGGDIEVLADGDEVEFTQGAVAFMDLISQAIFSLNSGD